MTPIRVLITVTTALAFGLARGAGAAPAEKALTILYSADERGEITPCG